MSATATPAAPVMTLHFPPELAERALTESLRAAGVAQAIAEAAEVRLALRGLLDKAAAAKFLKIEERTLEIWMRTAGDRGGRGVPHFKIGEAVRFTLPALEAWLAQYEVNKVLPKVA